MTKYSYDAFGIVTISGEISDNPFQYTGRENDGTGLYYYRARYYNPQLQRFVSEDPILKPGNPNVPFLLPSFLKTPAMLHAYNYVRNNPLKFRDPKGLFWWEIPVLLIPPLVVGGSMIYCELKCDRCNKLYPVELDEVGYDRNQWGRYKCMANCLGYGLLGSHFGADPFSGAVTAPSYPH